QVLARFEAERQALALMDHPHIAKVLDGGVHDGRPYFVMELVKGVPITDYCDHHKLTPQARLELFVQACQAIQHAHQKGVIHRDIKPSNVLVALYDDRPVVKVIDFGVAKATGTALTERTIDTGFGGVVGTPQYMSPEQATFNNLDIDTRSDVYALGVLLYELLTGSPPFSRKELEKKGLMEMLRVVREDEPPRPSVKLSTADALPSLSASRGTEPKKLTGLLRNELDWIVMKALEKDRSRRYETANGFAADVNRYLSGEAVQAHPPSTAYRVKKFVRKNRGPVATGSLVLLALLLGIAGTTLGLLRADQRRVEAEQAKQRESERADGERQAKEREAEQRAKAEAAERQATQSLAAEKAARTHARAALDTLTEEVVAKLLSQKSKLGPEERAFLTKTLRLYDGLTQDQEDTPEGRVIRANGYLNVGEIHAHLGNYADAEAALVVANDQYDRVVLEAPTAQNRYRRNLVRENLAGVYANRHRRDEANHLFLAVIEDGERLHTEFQGELSHQSTVAISILNYCLFNKSLPIDE
ncbi:MAG: protein kinase, partial [Gemmataceae bacterium]